MAQHDYDVANGSGAAVRADLNDVLEAVATNNSDATAPTTTFAHQWWFDTSTGILKQRNSANTDWVPTALKDSDGWTPYIQGQAIPTVADTYLRRNAGDTAFDAKTVAEVRTDLDLLRRGKWSVPFDATSLIPRADGATPTEGEFTVDTRTHRTLDFSDTATQHAFFYLRLPESFSGDISFRPIWSHPTGAASFGVHWAFAYAVFGNGDGLSEALAPAGNSEDVGGTADDLYIAPESTPVSITGEAGNLLQVRVRRDVSDPDDTLDVVARLHTVVMYLNIAAENDA